MPWDEDELAAEINEMFGDFRVFSPKADKLSVKKLAPIVERPSKAKTPEQMRAYKAAKQREYKERYKQIPPTELTKEILRRKAQERKLMRIRMPDLRAGTTHHFTVIAKCNKLKCVAGKVEGGDRSCTRCGGTGIREVDGYLTCNTYENGALGEIFVRMGKMGDEAAIYEQWAIAVSVAIQFGVPVEAYFRKFLATQFEPSGATINKDIPRCTSVLDYVARYILMKFCPKAEEKTEVQP